MSLEGDWRPRCSEDCEVFTLAWCCQLFLIIFAAVLIIRQDVVISAQKSQALLCSICSGLDVLGWRLEGKQRMNEWIQRYLFFDGYSSGSLMQNLQKCFMLNTIIIIENCLLCFALLWFQEVLNQLEKWRHDDTHCCWVKLIQLCSLFVWELVTFWPWESRINSHLYYEET